MFTTNLKIAGVLVTGTAGVMLTSIAAPAAEMAPGCVPAVSQVNGKLEVAGGYQRDQVSDGGRFQGVGTLDMPLGCYLGLQVDVAGGDLDGKGFAGVGGHLFLRDPSSYLFGVQAQYISLAGKDIFRVGPEAELYFNNVTLSAMAGYESANGRLSTDHFLAQFEVEYYATDNFKLYGGFRHFQKIDAGVVGAEYKVEAMPVSLFVDAAVGNKKYASVMGGFRFHFGAPNKSLMATQREDDPGNYFNLLVNSQGCVPRPVGDMVQAPAAQVLDAPSVNYCSPPPKPLP